jgi:prepilin-type N-terminal cleavage/methylation domain-containing protein
MKNNKKGFTLIELMIVVAIIGILAAIAIPKFADLINKSKEGATKGGLSSVRSAVQVYYGDNEGWFPTDTLACIIENAKYIASIPQAKMPGTGHADSNAVTAVAASAVPTDGAGWAYYNDPTLSASWGNFVVGCTHEDIKGRDSTTLTIRWSTF